MQLVKKRERENIRTTETVSLKRELILSSHQLVPNKQDTEEASKETWTHEFLGTD